MTSPSNKQPEFQAQERADYGFARVRDIAFDAVYALWRKRKSEGMKQKDLAKAINRREDWLSRNLSGPGNWTLRTLGELVEGLNGEIEINVYALEDGHSIRNNYSAYDDQDAIAPPLSPSGLIPSQSIGEAQGAVGVVD